MPECLKSVRTNFYPPPPFADMILTTMTVMLSSPPLWLGHIRQFPAGGLRIVLVDQISNLFFGNFATEAVAAENDNIVREAWGFHDIRSYLRPDAHGPGKNMRQLAA